MFIDKNMNLLPSLEFMEKTNWDSIPTYIVQIINILYDMSFEEGSASKYLFFDSEHRAVLLILPIINSKEVQLVDLSNFSINYKTETLMVVGFNNYDIDISQNDYKGPLRIKKILYADMQVLAVETNVYKKFQLIEKLIEFCKTQDESINVAESEFYHISMLLNIRNTEQKNKDRDAIISGTNLKFQSVNAVTFNKIDREDDLRLRFSWYENPSKIYDNNQYIIYLTPRNTSINVNN